MDLVMRVIADDDDDDDGPLRTAAWHLRQAERLLEEAAELDDARGGSAGRWSQIERSRAHCHLADIITYHESQE